MKAFAAKDFIKNVRCCARICLRNVLTSDPESSSQENDQNAHQTEANGHIAEDLNESDVESVATTAMACKPINFSAIIDSRTGDGISVFKGLDQGLFESLSKELSVWFPVQLAVLLMLLNPPTLLPPRDVAISAPTESGKTLCYLIPILNYLCVQPVDHLSALIVAPTRSLVQQIAAKFAKYNVSKAQIVVLSEFLSYEQERRVLFSDGSKKSNVNVIISTPQRLVEHLIDGMKQIDLTKLRYLVVDEADSPKFVREEWLGLVERLANYQCLHRMSYGSLVAYDKNTRLQKILVSATLSLEADKLHIWSLRCPRLFRANVSSVIEKRNAIEDEEKMEMDNKKDVRPTNGSGLKVVKNWYTSGWTLFTPNNQLVLCVCNHLSDDPNNCTLLRCQFRKVRPLASLTCEAMRRYSRYNPEFYSWFMSKLSINSKFYSLQ
ncbi:ATP-dependent RNA helicase DDX51 [Aphelenchoides besseyi]|nr:ATP-dependent RNA helicase DDX51 [Aphelenchoides besseyi]